MSESTRRFTRQELYELVWSEPMAQLARKFGLSDVGLSKACRRISIPVPERGYWAKLRAGKQVTRQPLTPRGLGMSDTILIGIDNSATYGFPEDQIVNEEACSPPTFSEGIPDLTVRIRKLVGKVVVTKSLARPHRLIARLLEEDEHRREKQQSSPYAWSWGNPIFDSSFERRRLRILNTVFLALERYGMKPSFRGHEARQLSVQIGEQHVSFSLDCATKRGQSSRVVSSQDKSSSERMRFLIPSWRGDTEVRKSLEDDGDAMIEDRLEDIVVELIIAGEAQYRELLHHHHEWSLQRKAELEEAARRRIEEEERHEREKQIKAQNERIERLLNEASALRQAIDIRAYVEAVRATNALVDNPQPRENVEEWTTWALAEADLIDPIRSGRFLEK